jgi:hypothetical protein
LLLVFGDAVWCDFVASASFIEDSSREVRTRISFFRPRWRLFLMLMPGRFEILILITLGAYDELKVANFDEPWCALVCL